LFAREIFINTCCLNTRNWNCIHKILWD